MPVRLALVAGLPLLAALSASPAPARAAAAEAAVDPEAPTSAAPVSVPHDRAAPLLRGVQIRGLPTGGEELARQLDLKIGEPLTARQVSDGLRRLYTLGNFVDVAASLSETPDGVILIFQVDPVRRIADVLVRGNAAFDRGEVLQALNVEPGQPLPPFRLEQARQRLANAYHRRGYRKAKVAATATPVGEGEVFLQLALQEGEPVRLERIEFRGRPAIPTETLLAYFRIRSGDIIDLDPVQEDLQRLAAYYRRRGYREARVSREPQLEEAGLDRATVVVLVQAGQRINLRWLGLRAVPAAAIERAIKLDDADDFSPAGAAELAKQAQDYLRKRGYAAARVKAQVTEDRETHQRQVLFTAYEGQRARLWHIRFAGNEQESSSRLDETLRQLILEAAGEEEFFEDVDPDVSDDLGTSGVNAAGPRLGGAPRLRTEDPLLAYRPDLLDKATAGLEGQYRRWGYLSAAIEPPRVTLLDRGGKALVELRVTEGVQTMVTEVKIAGATEFLPLPTARAVLQKNGPFDAVAAEEIRQQFNEELNQRGYIFNRAGLLTSFSADRRQVALTYRIEEGPRVRVGLLAVRGLVRTDDIAVRESLTFGAGSIYKPGEVDESRRNLFRLGIFRAVNINPVQPTVVEPIKDVVVEVEERPPQTLEPGFGVSTEDGMRGFLNYTHANLFGRAVEFTAAGRVSYQVFDLFLDELQAQRLRQLSWERILERRADVGLHYPHIFGFPRTHGVPHNAGARIDFNYERDNTRAYGLDRVAAVPGIDFELVPAVTLSLQYELEYTYLEILQLAKEARLTKQQQDVLMLPQGGLLLGTFGPALTYDGRDSVLSPRRGVFASLGSGFANGLSGDVTTSFIKLQGQLNGYIPLPRHMVIALSLQGGNIFSTSSYSVDGTKPVDELSYNERIQDERRRTPLHKRFYLGGRSTLRGFAERAVVPKFSQTPSERLTDLVGKDAQMQSFGGNTYVLTKAELRFPLAGAVSGALFTDIGGLWLRLDDAELGDLRPAAGFGIRYNTPVGPLSLDFGFNLTPDLAYQEPSSTIHFSIGLF